MDAVVGDAECAIEVKSSANVSSSDTKGLRAFGGEHPEAKLVLLSLEERPRMVNNVELWPVQAFLQRLWQDRVV